MDFVSNKKKQIADMLDTLGIAEIGELFSDIPASLRLPPPAEDDGLSEMEGMQLMEAIAAKNTFADLDSYLGGGAYEHHVPALVGAVCSKSAFLTAYTPYQAEASQGMLQAIFEFQSAVCALTGLDVANASVYDGACACGEALLMALRHHKRRHKVVVAASLHPHYRSVVDQYLSSMVNGGDLEVVTVPFLECGRLDVEALHSSLDDNTAAVLVQYPNFFGVIDDIQAVSAAAKEVGALTVLCANPLVYGLYASAAELGADIAVGDTQPLGLPLQFGGPYAGYMSCSQGLVRQLPGRLVGETTDAEGNTGFVLTLQAREQHIRREKATSNICSNQNLAALASLVTMLWYGKQGIHKLARTNYQRAAYLKEQLNAIPGVTTDAETPVFNEFVVAFDKPVDKVQSIFRKNNIEPGIDLGRWFPQKKGRLLVAVTETKNRRQLDRYIEVAREVVQ